jgi:glycosyltransferase involved in cell wall biosynthesis
MRVLVANIPLPTNRFLVDLNAGLSLRVGLLHSSDVFWRMEGDFDVIHLHFPEYLTYELQDAYINGLTAELIEAVRVRLDHWAARSQIIVTRHVLLPHDALEDPMWERMYEMVYSYVDGVVHFANASREEFDRRYGTTFLGREKPILHVIIPHQNYASLPNTITRHDARKTLGIPRDGRVMLVFGAIRGSNERQLILETFKNLNADGKVLLVSRWMENLPDVSWIRLKYWLRDLARMYYRFHPRFTFNYGFVDEADTQIYLNAADVLFIPRFRVLNSGNVTLGMTFGRVVVGPDSWDVGELLRETGNPTFDPDRPETAAAAVDRGFQLAREGKIGQTNRALALSEWTVDQCAEKYVEFFRAVTTRSAPSPA